MPRKKKIGPRRLTRKDSLYWFLLWDRINSPLH